MPVARVRRVAGHEGQVRVTLRQEHRDEHAGPLRRHADERRHRRRADRDAPCRASPLSRTRAAPRRRTSSWTSIITSRAAPSPTRRWTWTRPRTPSPARCATSAACRAASAARWCTSSRSRRPRGPNAVVWSGGSAPAAGTHARGHGCRRGARLRPRRRAGTGRDPGRPLAHVGSGGRGEPRRRDAVVRVRRRRRRRRPTRGRPRRRCIQVQGGTAAQQAMVQAALYHLFLMPTVQSDVDGAYVGIDGKTAQATGCHYCSEHVALGHVPHAAPALRPRRARSRERRGGVAPRDGEGERLLPQVAHRLRASPAR